MLNDGSLKWIQMVRVDRRDNALNGIIRDVFVKDFLMKHHILFSESGSKK